MKGSARSGWVASSIPAWGRWRRRRRKRRLRSRKFGLNYLPYSQTNRGEKGGVGEEEQEKSGRRKKREENWEKQVENLEAGDVCLKKAVMTWVVSCEKIHKHTCWQNTSCACFIISMPSPLSLQPLQSGMGVTKYIVSLISGL